MKKKIILICSLIGIVIIGVMGYNAYKQYTKQKILDSIQVTFIDESSIEYGSDFQGENYIQDISGTLKTLSALDTHKIGKQEVTYVVTKENLEKEFAKEFEVVDTQKPQITLSKENVTLDYGSQIDIASYIQSIKDPVDGDIPYSKDKKDINYYTYTNDIDTKKPGTYKIDIIAIDKNKNQTTKTLKITIKEQIKKQVNEETNTNQTTSTPVKKTTGTNKVIVIDPGHQGKGNNAKEAIGPGSSTKKAKVATGATGVSSGKPESQITLEIGLKLKQELESRGYTVIMTRTTQNVNISNQQRAKIGNQGDAVIHLHCDSIDSSSVRGAHTIAPSKNNPYCPSIYNLSSSLARNVINQYCQATGIKNRGVDYRNDLTGINWSEVPSIYLEMGFISNSKEDQLLTDSSFQNKCAIGIANGIDAYFS